MTEGTAPVSCQPIPLDASTYIAEHVFKLVIMTGFDERSKVNMIHLFSEVWRCTFFFTFYIFFIHHSYIKFWVWLISYHNFFTVFFKDMKVWMILYFCSQWSVLNHFLQIFSLYIINVLNMKILYLFLKYFPRFSISTFASFWKAN